MSLDQTELRRGGGDWPPLKRQSHWISPLLRHFEATKNLSLVMSLDQTELRQGGDWPPVKGSSNESFSLLIFIRLSLRGWYYIKTTVLFNKNYSVPLKLEEKNLGNIFCVWYDWNFLFKDEYMLSKSFNTFNSLTLLYRLPYRFKKLWRFEKKLVAKIPK